MSIRFAVLALIAERPLHGYAIHAALEERLAQLCEPAYGDVYRALKALARDRLVAVAEQRVGRRPRRKVYMATPAGIAALRAWLGSRPARGRDDLPLRLLLAGLCAADLVERILAVHAASAADELEDLLAQRGPAIGAPKLEALLRALHLEGEIAKARARLELVELCRTALERHRRGVPVEVLVRELAGPRSTARGAPRATG